MLSAMRLFAAYGRIAATCVLCRERLRGLTYWIGHNLPNEFTAVFLFQWRQLPAILEVKMNDTRLREDVEPALRAAQGSKMRYIRLGALIVFALITSYGLYLLFRGNWREVAAYWFARRRLLALAFCLSACDIFTDACIWQGILRQFGIRPGVRRGVLLFLSGYAGHLMPAQLGRFFRASEVARLGHGDFKTVAKVEIILLYFVIITSISVFTGAFLYRLWGVPAVVAPVCMIVAAMMATHVGIRWIPRLASLFPTGYWLRPSTVLLALAAAIGWLFNGAILYLIFKDVAENLAYTQTIMIMTSNLFILSLIHI